MIDPVLAIGSPVWLYDQNNRVYEYDQVTGRSAGSPLWRGYWIQYEIIAETRMSWVVGRSPGGREIIKLPKRAPRTKPGYIVFSLAELEDLEWVACNRYSIGRTVQDSNDVTLLKRVAELVGYKGKA